MDYTEEFLAGWTAAREVAQIKGSVPPTPPGYGVEAEEPSEPEPEVSQPEPLSALGELEGE